MNGVLLAQYYLERQDWTEDRLSSMAEVVKVLIGGYQMKG